ncbi:hypothetical protein K435DRAFT_800937 [Dendrothele bispora CBS 962.96]|uniref:Uncharacterized protein n=1 Tax=Dendrothele bispora (strain CBS 962.96) TaxID=1314807 RepID=A0A4S8LR15_DENBC|nr:hypothetical protein K435DRAFT_800937 [Dendrothele bispora CBS 962.96]
MRPCSTLAFGQCSSFIHQCKTAPGGDTTTFNGYDIKATRPVAVIHRWYPLAREMEHNRQDFLKATNDVMFLKQMTIIFCAFSYKTQGKMLTMTEYLTTMVSTTGSHIYFNAISVIASASTFVRHGNFFFGEVKTWSSISDLLHRVLATVINSPALNDPLSLEKEPSDLFAEFTMKIGQNRVPVNLTIGITHIRITSLRAVNVSPGIACKSTDIILLADVTDVYNVQTGQQTSVHIVGKDASHAFC